MQKLRRIARPIVHIVLLGFLTLALQAPPAGASIISTEVVLDAAQTQAARERVRQTFNRENLKRALLAHGVSPIQIQTRVDSLSDDEAQRLAVKIDQLPGGGDVIDALVLIFLVLLITDILGLTDVFPFVKKHARH